MDILLLDCPSVLFKLFQPPLHPPPPSLCTVFVSKQVTSLTPRQAREWKARAAMAIAMAPV